MDLVARIENDRHDSRTLQRPASKWLDREINALITVGLLVEDNTTKPNEKSHYAVE
jgi:hypothetical protein